MSKRFGSWTLGLVAMSVLLGATCGTVAAQAKSPQGAKPAATKGAPAQPAAPEPGLLTIGSKAPPLNVEHWISNGNGKFKPVTTFAPGGVYVVEFWATWCAPCVASMPHLAATQAKYGNKVQIVSISDEDLETIQAFLKSPVRAMKPAEEDAADAKGDATKGEKGGKEKATAAKTEEPKKQSYAELTSEYCLTTDPDGSSNLDFMEAAAQNGIPTSFIVGKTGQIEWIGHPMSIDEPLESIVAGKWDRAAFLERFKKDQDHDSMMAKLAAMMRKGDAKGALAIIDEAKKTREGDAAALASLNTLAFQVQVMPIIAKCEEGDLKEGMAELSALMKAVTPEQKVQLSMLRFKLLVEAGEYPSAAKALLLVADDKAIDADSLNQLTWQVYEAAMEDEELPAVLIDASVTATEKALAASPKSGMIMDTLAHLLHRQGKLDKAIAVQTQAIANSDDSSDAGKLEMAAYLKQLKQEKDRK